MKRGSPKSAPIRRWPTWLCWSVTSAASGCARKSCGCAKACPRPISRLISKRRDLPKADPPKPEQPEVANAPAVQPAERPTEVKPAPAPTSPVAQVRTCDDERATLARLRASQSREDVVKFERELNCEQLRPQVIRLKESLSGG